MTISALQILLGILEVPYTFHYPKDSTVYTSYVLIGCGSADLRAIWGKFFRDLEDAPKPIVKHDRNWGRFQNPYRRQSCPHWIHQHTSCRLSSLNLPRNAIWIYIWEACLNLDQITLVSQSTLASNLLQLTRRTWRRHKCQHVNSEGFGLGGLDSSFFAESQTGSKWQVFLFQSETICTLVGFFCT